MAVVTRPCSEFHTVRNTTCMRTTPNKGWAVRSTCEFIKAQLCTISISLTLFNSVRLPREAYRYGAVPYLVIYTFWLLVAGLPTTLLQLAMGQLSRQDPIGVWRAVPILRGVGHLKILTSYICCVYYAMYVALAAAYLIWIGKGTFPLKDCTKLHMTPNGYENKMNASECFNSTFLASFTEYPQYLGIMAILIFLLWFLVPVCLYRLHKTMKTVLGIFAAIIVVIAIVLCTFLSNVEVLDTIFESCEHWSPLGEIHIWQSTLVQALLSTHIMGGYLISAGGSVYKYSDVRWTSALIIMTNMFAGWIWVVMWDSIGGSDWKDKSFISILVLIYQSSVNENRAKEWPLLAFSVVLFSGIISMLLLLYPVYDMIYRRAGDHWRMFTCGLSAVSTILTVTVLSQGQEIATLLDDLVVSVLAVFGAAVEIIGFVFIYGSSYLTVDIEFLTKARLPYFWVITWWLTPVLLLGVTGWWLKTILQLYSHQGWTIWPLLAVFVVILVIMVMMAAVAVAKEEQFNMISKILSAFRPSRQWGPEEPMARYVWMSQRYINETLSTNNETMSDENNYAFDKKLAEDNDIQKEDFDHKIYDIYSQNNIMPSKTNKQLEITTNNSRSVSRTRKKSVEDKYRSPNVCIADSKLGGPMVCKCNRHFTLNVPDLRPTEITTNL